MNSYVKRNNKKSTSYCYAGFDFGFFRLERVCIHVDHENRLSWSLNGGWSDFHFNDTQIDNPYESEVYNLLRMIKKELDNKKTDIVEYLNNPSTASKWMDLK